MKSTGIYKTYQDSKPPETFFANRHHFVMVNYKTHHVTFARTKPLKTDMIHKYFKKGYTCEGYMVHCKWYSTIIPLSERNNRYLNGLHSMYLKHYKQHKNQTMEKVEELINKLTTI